MSSFGAQIPSVIGSSLYLLGSLSPVQRRAGLQIMRFHLDCIVQQLMPAHSIAYFSVLADYGRAKAVKLEIRDRLIGLGVIESLITLNDDHAVERRVAVLNFLRDVVEIDRTASYSEFCVRSAVSILGRLASAAFVKPEIELIESRYLDTAVQWLSDTRYQVRRFAAAIMLSELIQHVPSLVCNARHKIFRQLWASLSDPAKTVREVVACLLCALLQLVRFRVGAADITDQCTLAINVITACLSKAGSLADTHGALLLLHAMLTSDFGTGFISKNAGCDNLKQSFLFELPYSKLLSWCRAVWGKRGLQSKYGPVRTVAISLTPQLVSLVTSVDLPVMHVFEALLPCLDKDTELEDAFRALGQLARVVTKRVDDTNARLLFFHRLVQTINSGVKIRGYLAAATPCLDLAVQAFVSWRSEIVSSPFVSRCAVTASRNLYGETVYLLVRLLPFLLDLGLCEEVVNLVKVIGVYFRPLKTVIYKHTTTHAILLLRSLCNMERTAAQALLTRRIHRGLRDIEAPFAWYSPTSLSVKWKHRMGSLKDHGLPDSDRVIRFQRAMDPFSLQACLSNNRMANCFVLPNIGAWTLQSSDERNELSRSARELPELPQVSLFTGCTTPDIQIAFSLCKPGSCGGQALAVLSILSTETIRAVLGCFDSCDLLVRLEGACCSCLYLPLSCLTSDKLRRLLLHRISVQLMVDTPDVRCLMIQLLPTLGCHELYLETEMLQALRFLAFDGSIHVERAAVRFLSKLMLHSTVLILPRLHALVRCILSRFAVLLRDAASEICGPCETISDEPGSMFMVNRAVINSQSAVAHLLVASMGDVENVLWLIFSMLHRFSLALSRMPRLLPLAMHVLHASQEGSSAAVAAIATLGELASANRQGIIHEVHKALPSMMKVVSSQQSCYLASLALRGLTLCTTPADALTMSSPWGFCGSLLDHVQLTECERCSTEKHAMQCNPTRFYVLCGNGHSSSAHMRPVDGIAVLFGSSMSSEVGYSSMMRSERCLPKEPNQRGQQLQHERGTACATRMAFNLSNHLPKWMISDVSTFSIHAKTLPSLVDQLQFAALSALLNVAWHVRRLRAEALSCLLNVCSWLQASSVALYETFIAVLKFLCPKSISACGYGGVDGVESCLMESHGNIDHEESSMQAEADSHVPFVHCLSRMLELLSPDTILSECDSGNLPSVLSARWGHSLVSGPAKYLPLSACFERMAVQDEAVIDIIRVLHARLPGHDFLRQLNWIVPPLLKSLLLATSSAVLCVVDDLGFSLALSGHARTVMVAVLSRLDGLAGRTHMLMKSSSNHATNYDAWVLESGTLLVTALRLLGRVTDDDAIKQMAPLFLRTIISYLNRQVVLSASKGELQWNAAYATPVVHSKGSERFLAADSHIIVSSNFALPELALRGVTTVALQSIHNLSPYVGIIEDSLVDLATFAERVLDGLASSAVDSIFGSSPASSNIAFSSAQGFMSALSEYCRVTAALFRGQLLPSPGGASAAVFTGSYSETMSHILGRHPGRLRQRSSPALSSKSSPHINQSRTHTWSSSPELVTAKAANELVPDVVALGQAWKTDGLATSRDWAEWMRRVCVETLRQSPSPHLRPCSIVAEVHQPVAYQLFKPAFQALCIGCGFVGHGCTHLAPMPALDVGSALHSALKAPTMPHGVRCLLLEVCEYMHAHHHTLPLDATLQARQVADVRRLPRSKSVAAEIEIGLGCEGESHGTMTQQVSVSTYDCMRNNALCRATTAEFFQVKPISSLSTSPGPWEGVLGLSISRSNTIPDKPVAQTYIGRLKLDVASCELDILLRTSDARNTASIETKIECLRFYDALFDYPAVAFLAHRLWVSLLPSSLEHSFIPNAVSRQQSKIGSAPASAVSFAMREQRRLWLLEIARIGARAAWTLDHWKDMRTYAFECDNLCFLGCYPKNWISSILPTMFSCKTACKTGRFEIKSHELVLFRVIVILETSRLARGGDACPGMQPCIILAQARSLLHSAKMLLFQDVGFKSSRSYKHVCAYFTVAQQLAELEEVIDVRTDLMQLSILSGTIAQRKSRMKQVVESLRIKWETRQQMWAIRNVTVSLSCLPVRKQLLSPLEVAKAYVDIAEFCAREGQPTRCNNIIGLLDHLSLSRKFFVHAPRDTEIYSNWMLVLIGSRIVSQSSKLAWNQGRKNYGHHALLMLACRLWSRNNKLINYVHLKQEDMRTSCGIISSCYLQRVECRYELTRYASENMVVASLFDMLTSLHGLISNIPQYNAWHAWAVASYDLCEQVYCNQVAYDAACSLRGVYGCASTYVVTPDIRMSQAIIAVHSVQVLFRSLQLGVLAAPGAKNAVVLQDTLRLLTLCFKYSWHEVVYDHVYAGLPGIAVGLWLNVLPQLIARIDVDNIRLQHIIVTLLVRVGRAHPQALIYPLNVSAKMRSKARRNASWKILVNMQLSDIGDFRARSIHLDRLYSVLCEEANLVSCELHRVAVTWHEAWYHAIELAANHLFGGRSVRSMAGQLVSMHNLWQRDLQGASQPIGNARGHFESSYKLQRSCSDTLHIMTFYHACGCELQAAGSFLQRFLGSDGIADLFQAWDWYTAVHRTVRRVLSTGSLDGLNLCHAAPTLLSARNMELAVPGMYNHVQVELSVRIDRFADQVNVMRSKQRPRHLRICGSDGSVYDFLLKGHEDLRQDERVMQLFGLINAILQCTHFSRCRGTVNIQQYVVLPLSENSGLVEWVQRCSTLHDIISEHRVRFSATHDAEARYLDSFAPSYDKLMVVAKQDIFAQVLVRTRSQDLATMLWLTSEHIDSWLRRRCMFTRAVAVTSIVGYILGLGDRHLSNMMLNRVSGQVVHIDFGDCFDVSLYRELFPERVPFRLTRQLRNAMGSNKIEGLFRSTAHLALQTMRTNCRSLMAMLETFIHDPLVGWKLSIEHGPLTREVDESSDSIGALGSSLNKEPACVIGKIEEKLTGRACCNSCARSCQEQITGLVCEACSLENLCQMYPGWSPYL